MTSIVVFFALQLVNVIFGTIRSIVTNSGTKLTAAIVNAVSYTFYAAIVKLTTQQDMIVVIGATFITNMIGVYLAIWLLEKFKKDRLWRITVTIPIKIGSLDTRAITESLDKYNISYTVYIGNDVKVIDIYSKTQGESSLIKEILSPYDKKIKYFVSQMDKTL